MLSRRSHVSKSCRIPVSGTNGVYKACSNAGSSPDHLSTLLPHQFTTRPRTQSNFQSSTPSPAPSSWESKAIRASWKGVCTLHNSHLTRLTEQKPALAPPAIQSSNETVTITIMTGTSEMASWKRGSCSSADTPRLAVCRSLPIS
jgi:hypothetical protein